MRSALLAVSKAGAVLFRQNVGQGVVGRIEWIRAAKRVAVGPGDAIVRGARVFRAGLIKGSSDLIGWTPVVVTQDMVGKTVAIFTGVETKAANGDERTDQENFIKQVTDAGGRAGFAYSAEEAVAIVTGGCAR